MNDTIKNGGPAFPSTQALATASGVTTPGHAGLSLRDYFAAKVIAGLCSNPGGPFQANPMRGWGLVNITLGQLAEEAYDIADAMLAARGTE